MQKPYREKIKEDKFITGPLKKLAWTEWTLAISTQPPQKIRGARFKLSERYDVYLRKNLFDNDFRHTTALYEVGVMLPGVRRKQIYPVYYRQSFHGFSVYTGVEAISLLNMRQEAYRVLRDSCQIYMRNGVPKKCKDFLDREMKMEAVKRYLERFDYVWRKPDRHHHRKLVRNKIVLSDNKL